MSDQNKYRAEAEHLRREAEGMTDPVQQRMTGKLAELYDRLANYIEKARGRPANC